MSAGQSNVGPSVSFTVTSTLQVTGFPNASNVEKVTVVVPSGKVAGASFVVLAIPQLSAVVGVPNTTPVAVH